MRPDARLRQLGSLPMDELERLCAEHKIKTEYKGTAKSVERLAGEILGAELGWKGTKKDGDDLTDDDSMVYDEKEDTYKYVKKAKLPAGGGGSG